MSGEEVSKIETKIELVFFFSLKRKILNEHNPWKALKEKEREVESLLSDLECERLIQVFE